MLFGPWMLRTAVCFSFVALCLGNVVFASYENYNIYERSVERRPIALKDSIELQRYGNEYFERDESRLLMQTCDRNRKTNENDKHRTVVKLRENQKVSKEIRLQNSNIVENDTKTDVTRHLNNRMENRREFFMRRNPIDISASDTNNDRRHTSRKLSETTDSRRERLNSYGTFRRLELNEMLSISGRLGEHESEVSLNIYSKYREDLRQTDKRDAREYWNMRDKNSPERESTPRCNENSQIQDGRRSTLRRFNGREYNLYSSLRSGIVRDLQEVENERQRKDHETEGDVSRFHVFSDKSDANWRSQRLIERRYRKQHEIEQRCDENERELSVTRRLNDDRKSHRDSLNRLISQKNQMDLISCFKSYRKGDHCSLNNFDEREFAKGKRRSTNDDEYKKKRERTEFLAGEANFNNRVSQRSTSSRENNFRRIETSEAVRRLENDIKVETTQRRVEYKSENESSPEIFRINNYSEVQYDVGIRSEYDVAERGSLRERNIFQAQTPNEERYDNHINHNALVRHSEFIRDSQDSIARFSREENESTDRSYETSPDRHRHFEERETSRRFEDRTEERNNILRSRYGYGEERGATRQRDDHEITLRRLDDKSGGRVDRRSDSRDGRESQYDARRYLKTHNREAMEIFDDRESLRNTERRLDVIRKERYQFKQQEDIQRPNGEHESTHHPNENRLERYETLYGSKNDISRRLGNNRISDRNDTPLEENFNTRLISKNEPRPPEQRVYQIRRNSEQTFVFKQRNADANSFEADYAKKSNDFPKKVYMAFGQGAILAYVIAKTLNGKSNLNNLLPIQWREVVEVIWF